MPLVHSKTPKAFKKNIKTEMAHGKPQKQAVAIAYSEKRRAEHHKHAHGGEVDSCKVCMAVGGDPADQETLGTKIGFPGSPPPKPKPQAYAEGGAVDSWTKREDNEKGVNKGGDGISQAGLHVRSANRDSIYSDKEDSLDAAKRKHGKTLGELRGMKKPNLYAHGGPVEHPNMEGQTAANEKEPHKLAGGGEIEDGEDQMNQELHETIGSELIDALEKKDKKQIMSALEAAIMSCMNKG